MTRLCGDRILEAELKEGGKGVEREEEAAGDTREVKKRRGVQIFWDEERAVKA